MSSFWTNNIALFSSRFPALAARFGISPQTPEPDAQSLPFTPVSARNGSCTAQSEGKFLHSQYNPQREAEQAVAAIHKANPLATAFLGFGLGYAPAACAKLYPNDTLLIIEPSADWFFASLACADWQPVFTAKNIVLAIQAGVEEVTALIEKAGGGISDNVALLSNSACTAHAQDYFSALTASLKRSKQKESINTVTLERFSRLWLRNSCRNLKNTARLSGVARYKNACAAIAATEPLPALVLAAGPTLQELLPALPELKKRMLIICVDTALRACLSAGVEPDFIVLVDPQYYAWRHIAGLSAPTSVLITESAAYPAVYRFPCREIILCSSLFPLGKYFEKQLGSKGELAAGGSVSTTAWDFARLCGAKRIYMAGLDLGYPKLETHIRGSTFEEKLHGTSGRTRTAETGGSATLFGANMRRAKSYDGGPILTDDRMQLFAWWFESKQAEYGPTAGIQTYTLSAHSLCIPGIKIADAQALLLEPERRHAREAFFKSEKREAKPDTQAFDTVLATLKAGMESLYQTARKGLALCTEAQDSTARLKKGVGYYISALEAIDAQILNSEIKDIAALVFPTQRQLDSLYATESFSADRFLSSLQHSKIVYRELQNSVRAYLAQLD
ncbi:MAG: DUF115 domain-containing protein [Treponema sp.]|nr:DUF115 domain-containing protein [Treponema sp.]